MPNSLASIALSRVPILLAMSPFAQTLSAPTITASTDPRLIRYAQAESTRTLWAIPYMESSHAVSLDPCKRGRVSDTHTKGRFPDE